MTALTTRTGSVAGRLAAVAAPVFGGELPVRIEAWDGSTAGPAGAPTMVLRTPRALRRFLWASPELALAQAYVTGEIDVDGDLRAGLRSVWRAAQPTVHMRDLVRALRIGLTLGAVGPRPPAPASQARLRGRLHSRRRDRAAISHHYDLSNDFYALLLDESMAYSCAYWPKPSMTLADAQRAKLDLVCNKLGMRAGGRHLDIGCGWGSLAVHAAREFGVSVLGVTLSAEQREVVLQRVHAEGLDGLVEVRLQDYREIGDEPFDTVSSIEMGEHVGAANYPMFARRLHDLVRPGGRVLVQQMSRHARPGGGAFIERFIAPDMHMRPVGETVALLEKAGLEVRGVQGMREHYVRTADAWYETFERNWPSVVELVGVEIARVWRLYLVGGALAFEEARMGVDQILAERRRR